MSSHYNAIKEKRQILRDIYGGMMSIADLTKELGYNSPKSARSWLATVDVEAVKVGRGIRYETDQVAKAIVNGRGMV